MSEIRDWVHDNLKDARDLIGSGVEGAKSAMQQSETRVNFAESTKASWKATVVGATVGVVIGVIGDDDRRSRGALLGGVVGATLGLIAGLAWENHEALTTAMQGAGQSISATRDSQWLAHHPIDYA